MIGRNDPCWCGSEKKWKKCHYPQKGNASAPKKPNVKEEYLKKHHILIKSDKEIEGIRKSGHLACIGRSLFPGNGPR